MWNKIRSSFIEKKQKRKAPIKKKTNFFGIEPKTIFKKRKRSIFKKLQNTFSLISKIQNKKAIFLGFLLFIFFLLIVLIIGPFLRVKEIFILRQDNIININQAYSSLEYIRGKNILLLNTSEIAERLQKSQNAISQLEFNIKFPNTLEIQLKAYPPIFNTEKYIILENGTLLPKEDTHQYDVPYIFIHTQDEDMLLFGTRINVSHLTSIQNIKNELEKNILGFNIQAIQYFKEEKEVIFSDGNNTLYIFDLSIDTKPQVEQLSIFEKEGGNISTKKYIYIDARIPQKLYVCGYEEEFSCRNNIKNIYGDNVFINLPVIEEISQQ